MQYWIFKLSLKIRHVVKDTELPMLVSEFMLLPHLP
jgi:hypothetical protein